MVTDIEPAELITTGATNYSRERILLDELIASCNNYYNNSTHSKEKSEEIFATLANIINSEVGRKVVFHLLTHEYVTQYELTETIFAETSSMSRVLNKLRKCGIAEKAGIVKKPFRAGVGPNVHVWGLCGADPEGSIRAQKRYAELKRKENGFQQRRLKQKREAKERVKVLEDVAVEGYVKRVIDQLGFVDLAAGEKPIQKIDAELSNVNVPHELEESVRNEVIHHFYKIKL